MDTQFIQKYGNKNEAKNKTYNVYNYVIHIY